MNHFLSDKIKVISFILIILVLYIHSGFHNTPNEIQGMAFNNYLQKYLSGMIGRCAVPLFYAISGYLFFLNTNEGIPSILRKMKKRIRTLLIPYIIAAVFFPVFLMSIELLPFTKDFVNNGNFSDNLHLPLTKIFTSLFFAKTSGGYPWAFHLWFLRDLIIIVTISPLLYYIRKVVSSKILVIVLFALSFCKIEILPVYALFWFMAGDAFLIKLHKINTLWIPAIFIILSVVELVFPELPWKYVQIPIISLGVISIWSLYDRFVSETFELKKYKWLCLSCQFTFFIYLFHEPTLNIVRKLLIAVMGSSSVGFAISYLLSPWLFAFLFILFGYYFRKYLPRIYSVCVGGR